MMTITHRQARSFIQLAADDLLTLSQTQALKQHLTGCTDCQVYMRSLNELQEGLRRVTRQHWDPCYPANISNPIRERQRPRLKPQFVFGATAWILTAITLFVISSIVVSSPTHQPDSPVIAIPHTPHAPELPAEHPTATIQQINKTTTSGCKQVNYEIQPNDTLAGVADLFGVSEATLREYNPTQTEPLLPGAKLTVLICPHMQLTSTATPTLTLTMLP